jgi:hypothetical protein
MILLLVTVSSDAPGARALPSIVAKFETTEAGQSCAR